MKENYVGKSMPRYDGLAHVTGSTRYVDDVMERGALVCKGLRSPVARGKVIKLDTAAAEKLPGVYAVITGKDVPSNVYGGDQPVFATDIRFRGELLAAVAAVDEDTALEAVGLIDLEIEEQTPVFDPREAVKPGAPLVRPDGNVLPVGNKDHRLVYLGDIEKGFQEADLIVENDYFFPVADHTPMETQSSLAIPHANGKLTVYTTSQCLYFHLGALCSVLQMPMNKVKYVGGTVGGGFGSKNDLHADPVTAVLALKTGKPVKWRWTREEELNSSTVRGAWAIKVKDGVMKNGRIVARQMESIIDGGAYISFNPYVVDKHAFLASGPYYIPNVHISVTCVFTNKQPASSMRGFGITSCSYAVEVQINKIAEKLGMDPFEIRFMNALRYGEPIAIGDAPDSLAAIEVLQTLAQKAGIPLPKNLAGMTSQDRRF
jgi:CO/xanthine dehydrogenase Mo-binding subunit